MTREEAKHRLLNIERSLPNTFRKKEDVRNFEALEMAIKALEQEPVLDKVRAEIEQLTITEGGYDYTRKMAELYSLKIKVLQIIDKYKAESEEES